MEKGADGRQGKESRFYWGMLLALVLVFLFALPTMAASELTVDAESVGMDGIVLSKTALSLSTVTQSVRLTVTPIPDNATYDTVTWESSDPSIAVVTVDAEDSSAATVKAVANGATDITVTVTAGGETCVADCAVTVSLYNGFHQDPDSDDWYYYTDGKVDTSITEVVYGKVNGTFGWWNVKKGKVTPGVTVAKNANGWWYIDANGMVDFSYNGFAKNGNGSWYCENGKVTFSKQDIIKDTTGALGEKNAWYYVIKSKVQTDFTGLSNFRNSHGWWYIKNGKVDFTHNGVDQNKNGWWYVTDGKVQFGFTGLANYRNANGWWYIKKGKVDFTHNGVDKNKNGWWYVTSGKVRFGFTGLANYRNAHGWWYIKNGKVDFTANTVAKNKNGWWYVDGGKVIFDDCLTYAAQFVGANTKSSQSASEKLQACYTYMRNHYNYTRYYGTPTAKDLPSCAVDYFKNRTGNCYRYASAVTCIAKVLGYETRTALGQVESSQGNGIMSAHGWCEVQVNGTWYILDANFGVYMKTMEQYPRKLTADHRYTLHVTGGKAVWK